MCSNVKMDIVIYLCLITIVLIQLPSPGEAFPVNRKRNGRLNNKVNTLEVENNDVDQTIWKRHIYEVGNKLQQHKSARAAIDEEIKELKNRFRAIKRLNLNGVNDHLTRVKRGWWWCTSCDTSKLTEESGCKCDSDQKTTCKCPEEKEGTSAA